MAAAALVVLLSTAGCGAGGEAAVGTTGGSSPSPTISSADPTGNDGGSSPTSATSSPLAAAPADWCAGLVARTGPTVAASDLTELSGLAASHSHPGVLWAHNDSGHAAAVFAVGPEGEDQGLFPLPGVTATDIEDMALVDGLIYLADIGDNREQRDDVAVYRFPEPDPASPGPVDGVETLRLRYPDRPHDAEAVLVDPSTGDLIVITKAFQLALGSGEALLGAAPADVFVAATPLRGDGVNELQLAGTLALDQLEAARGAAPAGSEPEQLGLGGVATAADISADGRVVAVRTYDTIWLFDRPEGTSVAEALTTTPCEAPTVAEEQGEAVAFLAGPGVGLVTASEGAAPELHPITGP